ncbi:MAG: hypothetical protein ACXW3K_06425 [Brevundimonas sp.]
MGLRKIALVSVAGAALTAGCATIEPPLPAVLEYARQDCHPAPDVSAAISLTPEKETNGHLVTTVVGPQTACLTRAGGPTPYVVYALPADLGDKTLAVGGVLEGMRILSPDVSVLNARGEVTRAFAPSDYFYRGPVYSVQFKPREGDAFVLVASDRTRVGRRYDAINVGTNTTMIYTGFGAANITTGVEAATSRMFSHEGTVQVIVYDTDTKEEGSR